LSYRVATARFCFHLLTHRSAALRRRYWALSKAGGAAARRAPPLAAGALVVRLGDGCLDMPPPQVGAVAAAGVGLVAAEAAGAVPRPARPAPADPQPLQHGDEHGAVTALARGGLPGQRPGPVVGQQVDLAGQPAP